MTFSHTFIRPLAPLSAIVLLSLISVGCAGIRGTKAWESGKYYQSELNEDVDVEEIASVGVYVFSDGKAIDGSKTPFDAVEVVDRIIQLPMQILGGQFSFGTPQIGMSTQFFPGELDAESTLKPDTANSGPSFELARNIELALEDMGYNATVVDDLGHSGQLTANDCIAHARDNGFDAAFVVYYSGLNRWTEFAGTHTSRSFDTEITTTFVNTYDGYLFLPNSSFFDAASGELIWKNWYYGVYENAHTINLSGETFIEASTEALLPFGKESYVEAAKHAMEMIFNPAKWRGTFREFPVRGDRNGRM